MNYTLGIDTGTTSVSMAAVNSSREVIDSITVNHEAFIQGDFPESRIQSPERIREIVMAGEIRPALSNRLHWANAWYSLRQR